MLFIVLSVSTSGSNIPWDFWRSCTMKAVHATKAERKSRDMRTSSFADQDVWKCCYFSMLWRCEFCVLFDCTSRAGYRPDNEEAVNLALQKCLFSSLPVHWCLSNNLHIDMGRQARDNSIIMRSSFWSCSYFLLMGMQPPNLCVSNVNFGLVLLLKSDRYQQGCPNESARTGNDLNSDVPL